MVKKKNKEDKNKKKSMNKIKKNKRNRKRIELQINQQIKGRGFKEILLRAETFQAQNQSYIKPLNLKNTQLLKTQKNMFSGLISNALQKRKS